MYSVKLFHNAHICGTDDLVHGYELFDTVCTPADDPRYGEYSGVEFLRDAEHLIYEAAVEVDIGADALVDLSLLSDKDGS